MWLNLRPYLPQTAGDEWEGERVMAAQLASAGVVMSTGERYQSEQPGRFRMIFTYDEATLREGIRR
jgi:1-aminocyclopropane-1-carboxylate synthase